jgi:plasmid maintenance system antidote protein VapI
MTKSRQNETLTDVLKAAIVASELPLLTLQEETGVPRASIMRFVRGEQSLRLDVADKLAAYFQLQLVLCDA